MSRRYSTIILQAQFWSGTRDSNSPSLVSKTSGSPSTPVPEILVRMRGLEPPRADAPWLLRPSCMPVPAHPQILVPQAGVEPALQPSQGCVQSITPPGRIFGSGRRSRTFDCSVNSRVPRTDRSIPGISNLVRLGRLELPKVRVRAGCCATTALGANFSASRYLNS